MSRNEMYATVQACKLFLNEYEIQQRNNKNKCARFFDIIKHIRMFFQLTTELLKRIEALEEEISNLKLENNYENNKENNEENNGNA